MGRLPSGSFSAHQRWGSALAGKGAEQNPLGLSEAASGPGKAAQSPLSKLKRALGSGGKADRIRATRPILLLQITFQFTPSHLDVTEAFWTFLIPEHNISVPFLLVGKVTDPLLSLSKAHLNFSSLLVGKKALATVVVGGSTGRDLGLVQLHTSRTLRACVSSAGKGHRPPGLTHPLCSCPTRTQTPI